MPLLDTLWSPPGRMPLRCEAVIDDDELALGWECAVPALQVEAWEPLVAPPIDLGFPPSA
jgi:hypothetical protein